MSKLNKSYSLSKNTVLKIETLAIEKSISYTASLELMVDSYFANRSEEHKLLKSLMSELMDEKLASIKEDLKKVWVTGNVIDRNVQMEMEFWNHYFLVNNFDKLGSTLSYKTEEFKEAEDIVKNRIAHNRQRKLDWEASKKKKE